MRHMIAFVVAGVLLATGCQDYSLSSIPGYLGKEFFAADLNNYDGDVNPVTGQVEGSADAAQFSVTVSNPINSTGTATVSIMQEGGDGAGTHEKIEPGELEIFDLPQWDCEDTFYGDRSFFVESDVPVTVHQFNPANNEGVYSNDASLLLPVHSLGDRYRAACWRFDNEGITTDDMSGFSDFITVVATQDDTTVRVVPTADIRSGENVAAVQSGALLEMTLNRGEVLQVESDNTHSPDGRSDLTGSLITGSHPIAVFSGNECALIPDGVMACDHIEEQLFPVSAWGVHYFVVKFEPRKTEDDLFRIIADDEETLVETQPSIDGFPVTLNGGEFIEFVYDGDFEVTASQPVSVVQYMTGSQYCGPDLLAVGDPAMLVALPEEQFIDEYIFLTPEQYLDDYINVIAPKEISSITIDDSEIDGSLWVDFPSGDYMRARVPVEPGTHHLQASQDVGVIVYGYDDDVSYAYPGGAYLTPNQEQVEN